MALPGLTTGLGAGVGAVADFAAGSRDDAGVFILISGASPQSSSQILKLVFSESYQQAPVSINLCPVNENSAQLGQASAYAPQTTLTNLGFELFSTGIPLAPGLEYRWSYALMF